MKNHYYCDYLDNEQFLEEVEKYCFKYDNDFHTIKESISDKVSRLVYNAHGDQYDVNDYISQAKSLLNVLQHINETLHAEVD
jgi:hypothetical protein